MRLAAAQAHNVCIDITSGTKPVSIAGAISTTTTPSTFMYVNNQRRPVAFDARISSARRCDGAVIASGRTKSAVVKSATHPLIVPSAAYTLSHRVVRGTVY